LNRFRMSAIDLSAFFQTKAQAADFSSRLATLSEKIYETNFNLEKSVMEQFGLKKKDAFMTMLRDQNVAVETNTVLKQFLTDLQKDIAGLPVLSLTLAFEPKDKTLKALSEWFVLNIKRQIILEITVDPQQIAGASISFNGKDVDFSIRSKFDGVVRDFLTKSSDDNEQKKSAPLSPERETGKALA
jgi:hypothetical protein